MSTFETIITSIAPSIPPLMRMFWWLAYVLGIYFVLKGLYKASIYGRATANSSTNTPVIIPITYIVMGVLLMVMPTFYTAVTNTFFGSSSPLAYQSWFTQLINLYGNSTYVIKMLIKLSGLIWFVRGCVLVVQSSERGSQNGPKGMAFMLGGIFAMNFNYTAALLANTTNFLVSGKYFLHAEKVVDVTVNR